MDKNPNLFCSCRNALFESINQSSRGIIFKCKFEQVMSQNQAQIGHYIQMPMYGAIHLNTTTLYSQSRKVNFDPFSYPSGKNDPIGSTNKTVRQIFNWVKIVINSRSPCILLVGA